MTDKICTCFGDLVVNYEENRLKIWRTILNSDGHFFFFLNIIIFQSSITALYSQKASSSSIAAVAKQPFANMSTITD